MPKAPVQYCEVCGTHVELNAAGCAMSCGMEIEGDLDLGYESDCPYQSEVPIIEDYEEYYDEDMNEVLEEYRQFTDIEQED